MKTWGFFLAVIFFLSNVAFAQSDLIQISGKLIQLEQGKLVLETAPGTQYTAIIKQDLIAVNHGKTLPLTWLLPGDGIAALVNAYGKAIRIDTNISWTAGTVAFSSANRLTLLEGQQFFLSGAPVYLNGAPVDPTTLQSPEQVLVRFDKMNKRVVGVWAFKTSDDKPLQISESHASLMAQGRGKVLWVQVLAQPGGRLTAELSGVTQHYLLIEKKPGVYHGTIPVPMGISIPVARMRLQWNDVSWLDPTGYALLTATPVITEVGPPPGAIAPVNPPFIFVSFDKRKPPITAKTTQLFFDRKNVTGISYIDDYTIFFAPPKLARGRHQCYVTGDRFNESWSFFVR